MYHLSSANERTGLQQWTPTTRLPVSWLSELAEGRQHFAHGKLLSASMAEKDLDEQDVASPPQTWLAQGRTSW